jgi:hypothetical protein
MISGGARLAVHGQPGELIDLACTIMVFAIGFRFWKKLWDAEMRARFYESLWATELHKSRRQGLPMRDLWARVQSFWRDEVEQLEQAGRTELACDLTAELRILANDIRNEWRAARADECAPCEVADAYYTGAIEVYNRVSLALHQQDAAGLTNADYLTEILHPEAIKNGIDRAVKLRAVSLVDDMPAARNSEYVKANAFGFRFDNPFLNSTKGN